MGIFKFNRYKFNYCAKWSPFPNKIVILIVDFKLWALFFISLLRNNFTYYHSIWGSELFMEILIITLTLCLSYGWWYVLMDWITGL